MRVAIIGAGAVGLTAGHRLACSGHQVDVYDRRTDIGGLASAFPIGGTSLERIYHHVFTSDHHLLALLDELHLGDAMRWHTPRSGLYVQQRLHPFSGPMDLIRFRALPFHQRIAMGLLVLRARYIRDWQALETTTAREWLVRHAGQTVYDRIWGPLIQSKFDRDADGIAAVWIWNKFKLRGSTRGKQVSSEAFGYLQGSYGRLYETLVAEIRKHCGTVELGRDVTNIRPHQDGGISITCDVREVHYDSVLMTGSPEQLLQIAEAELPQGYADLCRNMRYKANLCAVLELEASLSPYYWITIADKEIPFVLVIEHTNLVSTQAYGSHVVYLSRYLDATDPLFTASDEAIEAQFLMGLEAVFPTFSRSQVKSFRIERERYAQPVVGLDHGAKIPAMETPVQNMYLASMAQIYPEDRGQNYAIRMGEQVADMIMREKRHCV